MARVDSVAVRSLLLIGPLVLAACGGGSSTYDCTPACPAGFSCTASGCVASGTGGPGTDLASTDLAVAPCGGQCSGTTPFCNDRGRCVACLQSGDCPSGSVCRTVGDSATCVPGCDSDARCTGGQKCCAGACVDVSSSDDHCGSCATVCSAPHGASHCMGGQCQGLSCNAGWGDCNAMSADGCETNLHADAANCGACGMVCAPPHAFPGCDRFCYVAGCEYGWDDCNDDPKDGCEIPVLTDTRNCGGCGMNCVAVPHAAVGCTQGGCSILSCGAGFADCDGNYADGCETTTSNDARNCGACGNVCGNGLVCVAGQCTCPPCAFPNAKAGCIGNQCVITSCNNGWADCDGKPVNGCERNVNTDVNNCGACGVVCAQNLVCGNGSCTCPMCNYPNAKSKCINLMCAFDGCLPGFADCNQNQKDGCEVDLDSDPANCSACGKACNQGDFCVAGACVNVPLVLVTDITWKQAQNQPAGWEQPGFNDANWDPGVDEGGIGTAPWGNLAAFNGSQARWIWYYDSRNGGDNSTVYFRKGFKAVQANMTLVIAADNIYVAYIDGVQVGFSNDVWSSVKSFNVQLQPGKSSVMAVSVTNQGGPGGLIVDMH